MSAKVVAVTGASGFVGRQVVRELLSRGWTVRALLRDAGKAGSVLPTDAMTDGRIVPVMGGALDGRSERELVKGVGACINLIGIIREASGGQTFRRMHVEAPRALVDACRAEGVSRFVQMSALGADPDGRAEYQRTKFEGEQLVRRSGLEWTALRPSFIHGPDGEFIQMMRTMATGETAPWFFMPYFIRTERDTRVPMGGTRYIVPRLQPVWVKDVAWLFAEALERRWTVGEAYAVVGPEELRWPEMLEFLRDVLPGTNHKLPPWHIPGTHAALIARAAKWLGLGGMLPYDEGQALMGMEDSTADLNKLVQHFGRTPAGFRETVRSYAAQTAA